MTDVQSLLPEDAPAREQALDAQQSFAVSAPAGSGKTGLLTQRVLKLLAVCDSPEEVLCITFTRKAAGEMQDRIGAAILFAHENPRPENSHEQLSWDLARQVLLRDQECDWQLLKAPNRLRVMTIDGFCRSLTRQLPLASGLGAQPDTIEQAEDAYRQAARALMAELEKESALSEDLFLLLEHLDNNTSKTEELLISLLQRREQWLPLMLASRHSDAREWLQSTLSQVVTDAIDTAHCQLKPYASELAAVADRAGRHLVDAASVSPIAELKGMTELPAQTASALPSWLALSELLLKKDEQWRKQLTVKEGFPPGKTKAEKAQSLEHKNALKSLIQAFSEDPDTLASLQQLRHLPDTRYSENQWQILDCLTRVLLYLVAELKVVFRNLGATDFSEITQAALLALGDDDTPGDIALRLNYQIKHILVDEFQDTAQPQLNLLKALTRGWEAGDGRTLFIVGDGMQSCYGFREANVGIFLNARQQGIGDVALCPLDLSVNFRSHEGIVEWVNRVFISAFPASDDIARGAVKYAPSSAYKPSAPGPAVQCHIASGEYERVDEAAELVRLVRDSKIQNPEGSIAILVRTRSHLQETLEQLSEANISWQATDIDPLSSRMAIVDLLSLTRALLYPDDRIAWLSVLRSPWCGLDLKDLHCIADAHNIRIKKLQTTGAIETSETKIETHFVWESLFEYQNHSGLSAEAQQILARVKPILSDALSQKRRKNLRHWVQGVWLALGGPATLCDSVDLDNAQSFFKLLSKHARAGRIISWEKFSSAIDQLYAAPRSDADASLQVMTIHKSKGLEFDTVIIPGLDRQPRHDDKSLLLWKEVIQADGSQNLLLAPLAPSGENSGASYQYLSDENKIKNRLESTRLLYVGCTRAIERLYLLGCLKVDEKNSQEEGLAFKAPASASLLASIWPAIQEELKHIPSSTCSQAASESDELELQHILRLPPAWQSAPLQKCELLKPYRGQEFDDEENVPQPDSVNNKIARHLGTVLHRCLQRIVIDGHERWDAACIERHRPFWQAQLRQLGLPNEDANIASQRIQIAVERMLADQTGLWLLDPNHLESECELALWHTTRDKTYSSHIRESIIDRTFIELRDGERLRWIIDYKSSEPGADQSLSEFLQDQQKQYRPQLQRYASLMAHGDHSRICTALYFPMLQRLELVDLAEN